MQTRRTRSAAGLALAALAVAFPHAASAAGGVAGKTDAWKTDAVLTHTLAAPPGAGELRVIVHTAGPLTPRHRSQLAALGAGITHELPMIGSLALHIPARHLGRLAALPFVTHLSSDGPVRKCDEFTVASSGAGQAYAQYGLDGSGVTVAVLDSGLGTPGADSFFAMPGSTCKPGDVSKDLQGKDFLTPRLLTRVDMTGTSDTNDYCGHGTHVAGIIAGSGANSAGFGYSHTYYGIARAANLVSVKVLNSYGGSDVSTVVAGLQWVVSNRSAYGIRVVNLSLGHPVGESYRTDPLCQAVEAAWKAGIVVVCAAGNSGRLNSAQSSGAANEGWGAAYGSIQSPGNDPYVITVGATKSCDGKRADDRVATYSSRGPSRLDLVCKPDILAPGNKIVSTDANNSLLDDISGGTNDLLRSAYMKMAFWTGGMPSSDYFVLSGTSMAAPVVAGAAALLLQKYPSLSPDTVKARLMIGADKWAAPDGTADLCTYGAGYLNIPNALTCNLTVPAGAFALSPQLTRNANGTLTLNTDSTLAANHVVWGSVSNLNVVWGSNLVSGSHVVWGSNVVWGSSVWADHVVWGSTGSAVDLSSVAIKGE